MDGRILDYVALGILIFVLLTVIYGIIFIHDIPYEMAKKRNHPHQDAIHTAGWVSLFLMHTIWPFLWIWATLYKPGYGWGLDSGSTGGGDEGSANKSSEELKKQIASMQQKQMSQENEHKNNIMKLSERITQLENQIAKEAEK